MIANKGKDNVESMLGLGVFREEMLDYSIILRKNILLVVRGNIVDGTVMAMQGRTRDPGKPDEPTDTKCVFGGTERQNDGFFSLTETFVF